MEWEHVFPPLESDFVLFLLDFLSFLVALGICTSESCLQKLVSK